MKEKWKRKIRKTTRNKNKRGMPFWWLIVLLPAIKGAREAKKIREKEEMTGKAEEYM